MSEPTPTTPTTELAYALRSLRDANGSPTLDALSRKTGVSKSVLSDAFGGKKLPTERTIQAVAHAFDADPSEMIALRRVAEPKPAAAKTVTQGRFGLGLLITVAVAGLVVGAVGGGLSVWETETAQAAHAEAKAKTAAIKASDAPQIVVKNGTDPANTACVNDAKVVASQTETHDTQLQIIYSSACHAAWSRINRYDGKALGNEISTSIYRQIAPHAKDRQDTTEPDIQSAYTTLIVRPSPDTEICATGSITLGGQTIDLGTPVCL